MFKNKSNILSPMFIFQAQKTIRGWGSQNNRLPAQRLREDVSGQLGDEEAPAHARSEDSRVRRVRQSLRRELQA